MEREIKCITLDNKDEVTEKLNEWRKTGWNINNYFISITGHHLERGPYTIWYDSLLDTNG